MQTVGERVWWCAAWADAQPLNTPPSPFHGRPQNIFKQPSQLDYFITWSFFSHDSRYGQFVSKVAHLAHVPFSAPQRHSVCQTASRLAAECGWGVGAPPTRRCAAWPGTEQCRPSRRRGVQLCLAHARRPNTGGPLSLADATRFYKLATPASPSPLRIPALGLLRVVACLSVRTPAASTRPYRCCSPSPALLSFLVHALASRLLPLLSRYRPPSRSPLSEPCRTPRPSRWVLPPPGGNA